MWKTKKGKNHKRTMKILSAGHSPFTVITNCYIYFNVTRSLFDDSCGSYHLGEAPHTQYEISGELRD